MTTTDDAADAPGAPGTPGLHTTDPRRVRALAHPVRLELLAYLDDVGEATATACAEHLGQTVANCSFHLRTLARAGYIEPAERRGRDRPWRVVSRDRTMTADVANPASVRAVAELGELSARREVERFIAHLRRVDATDHGADADVALTSLMSAAFWATPEETQEVMAELRRIADRFDGRREDPTLRPPGARHMRWFSAINPDDHPTGATHTTPEATDATDPTDEEH